MHQRQLLLLDLGSSPGVPDPGSGVVCLGHAKLTSSAVQSWKQWQHTFGYVPGTCSAALQLLHTLSVTDINVSYFLV